MGLRGCLEEVLDLSQGRFHSQGHWVLKNEYKNENEYEYEVERSQTRSRYKGQSLSEHRCKKFSIIYLQIKSKSTLKRSFIIRRWLHSRGAGRVQCMQVNKYNMSWTWNQGACHKPFKRCREGC